MPNGGKFCLLSCEPGWVWGSRTPCCVRYKRIGVIGTMSLVRRYSALYLTPEAPMPAEQLHQVSACHQHPHPHQCRLVGRRSRELLRHVGVVSASARPL